MASKNHFAVAKGKKTGVFLNTPWEDIQPLVSGVSGALYKGFYEAEAAEEWYATHSPDAVERGGLVVYVDGSNTSSGQSASWAYLIGKETPDETLYEVLESRCGRAKAHHLSLTQKEYAEALAQRNIFGELVAAALAVQAADKLRVKGDRITLLHDYLGIARYATGAWPNRKTALAQNYYEALSEYTGRTDFVHVKGHTGVVGNEIADDLAGFALGRKASLPMINAV